MKLVIAYLLLILSIVLFLAVSFAQGTLPDWVIRRFPIPFLCSLSGGLGGVVYCLRGVYLNACVRKQWDEAWLPWYYIRPLVSIVCGLVSCLFLKAGLLVLEASQNQDSTNLGFLALAFIAGLNVDKFIAKVEDIAQATWGIEHSRAGAKPPSVKNPDE